jgi:hypothetical protein
MVMSVQPEYKIHRQFKLFTGMQLLHAFEKQLTTYEIQDTNYQR